MKKEIELKYLISTKREFDQFKKFLMPYLHGKIGSYRQENFYFDTPTLHLRKNGISLRLRNENAEFWLSAKQSLGKKHATKNLSVRLEYEGKVPEHIASLMQQELLSPIDAFSILPAFSTDDENTKATLHRHMNKVAKTGLQMIGSFCNMRTKIPITLSGQELELELDHSRYPQSIEIFEIEIEFPSQKRANALRQPLEELFQAAGIQTKPSCSKSSRLYKLLFG